MYIYSNNVKHRLSQIEERVPDGKMKHKQVEQMSQQMLRAYLNYNRFTAEREIKEELESSSQQVQSKANSSFRDPAQMTKR